MAQFVNCKKMVNIVDYNQPKAQGGFETFVMFPGFIGEVPDWVTKNWYYKALCNDGTITAIVSTANQQDLALQESEAKAKAAQAQAERAALIAKAKEEAKAEAEKQAREQGLDKANTTKLINKMQAAALEKLGA